MFGIQEERGGIRRLVTKQLTSQVEQQGSKQAEEGKMTERRWGLVMGGCGRAKYHSFSISCQIHVMYDNEDQVIIEQ